MLRVAAHIEAFHECGACVGAAAGKGLTAMRELVFGIADVRQNEGLQQAHELMETILPGLLLQLVEQDVHTADGCAGIRLGWIPGVRTDSLVEQSDCLRCQAEGRVAYKVHSLWDRFKNPGCGLMDNQPLLHAGVGHGGLHGVLSRTMALRIVSILRNAAIRAAFGSTPRPSKRW
jgi:hypothetical protein